MQGMKYIANVATLSFETENCKGCGFCTEVCPHDVLHLINSKIDIKNPDDCMECGACMKNCPFGAIKVNTGVGCATAVILGMLKGTEPDCGCSGKKTSCCGN